MTKTFNDYDLAPVTSAVCEDLAECIEKVEEAGTIYDPESEGAVAAAQLALDSAHTCVFRARVALAEACRLLGWQQQRTTDRVRLRALHERRLRDGTRKRKAHTAPITLPPTMTMIMMGGTDGTTCE